MSPAALQPSNASSSESKKSKKADTPSVIQEKENENEEKLEWPKDMVLRFLELLQRSKIILDL